jgi:hypothetical protein
LPLGLRHSGSAEPLPRASDFVAVCELKAEVVRARQPSRHSALAQRLNRRAIRRSAGARPRAPARLVRSARRRRPRIVPDHSPSALCGRAAPLDHRRGGISGHSLQGSAAAPPA